MEHLCAGICCRQLVLTSAAPCTPTLAAACVSLTKAANFVDVPRRLLMLLALHPRYPTESIRLSPLGLLCDQHRLQMVHDTQILYQPVGISHCWDSDRTVRAHAGDMAHLYCTLGWRLGRLRT